MTAEEIRSVVFQKTTIGGYKQSDVDLFLDEVAVFVESLTAKIRALEKANAAGIPMEKKPQPVMETPKPEFRKTSGEGISDYGIQSLLLRAQRLAEQIEDEARQASEELLAKSAEDAKDIIERADMEAAQTIEKANSVLAEAERKEASINAAARAEAENIINEAVARSGQMLTTTREKLKEEQELCAKLRTEFKQVRNVIIGFYEEQLKELTSEQLEAVLGEDEEIAEVSVAEEATIEEIIEEVAEETYEESEVDEILEETFEEAQEEADSDDISSVSEEAEIMLNFSLDDED